MKYFLDTEFIEGFHKPLLGKRRHHIDLISIGIKSDDNREYYAISNEFNPKDADPWVLENVLDPMVHEWVMSYNGDGRNYALNMIEGKSLIGKVKVMQREVGKSNLDIAFEIAAFMGAWRDTHFWRAGNDIPEVYAYYADYDWVVFCSLFGRMIDLPKGFPMYCKDLKQIMDEKVYDYWMKRLITTMDKVDFEYQLQYMKGDAQFPKQKNEHSAIDDARWNKKLYEFLQTL